MSPKGELTSASARDSAGAARESLQRCRARRSMPWALLQSFQGALHPEETVGGSTAWQGEPSRERHCWARGQLARELKPLGLYQTRLPVDSLAISPAPKRRETASPAGLLALGSSLDLMRGTESSAPC